MNTIVGSMDTTRDYPLIHGHLGRTGRIKTPRTGVSR